MLGDIAAHANRFEIDTAQAYYRRAMDLAEELSLRPLVAHCHLGLGTLYRCASPREQAREHLAMAVTMFSEMDTLHWREQALSAMTGSI